MKYQTTQWINCRYQRWDGRYYGLAIEQDLLGNWLVRRTCGGMGKPTGQSRVTPCDNLAAATTLLTLLKKRRIDRQYTLKYLH